MDYPIKILSQLRPTLIGFRKNSGNALIDQYKKPSYYTGFDFSVLNDRDQNGISSSKSIGGSLPPWGCAAGAD